MNLNQLTIYSKEPQALIEFYSLLGLQLIVNSSPRYVRFVCPKGDSTLSIHQKDTQTTNNAITIYFEVTHLEKEVIRLKSLKMNFITEIAEQPWLWTEIELNDPDGNLIILYSAGENRKNPPWRVK